MLFLRSGPYTGTLSQSTLKSKDLNSSKFTSSDADTDAVANERKGAESTMGGEDKGALELIDHLVDDERKASDYDVPASVTATMFGGGIAKASDYDVPRPVTVTATMFGKESVKASHYDVPRPVTVTATMFGEGSVKANEYDVLRPVTVTTTMLGEGSAKASGYDVPVSVTATMFGKGCIKDEGF